MVKKRINYKQKYLKMKILISLVAFFIGISGIIAQYTKSDCDEYRKIIENNIKELQMDDFGRSMIVGKNDEYIKSGLSKNFVSEPKVPNYIYTADNLNMKMVDIIIAHVDLYHCDVEELNHIKNKVFKAPHIESEDIISVYPNPTKGIINIENIVENVEQILFSIPRETWSGEFKKLRIQLTYHV